MKILHVSCGGLGNGGVQNIIMNICLNNKDIYFDIILFTSEKRYYDDEFKRLGGKIFRIPNYEGKNKYRKKIDFYIRFFRIFFGTYKIIKNEGSYDVIHCHNNLESGICNLVAYLTGIKIRISHSHTSNNRFQKRNIITYIYKRFLQRLVNCFSNVKIGCSKKAFLSLFGDKYLYKANSLIVHNAVDLSIFHRTQSNVKLNTEINIVHIGRYSDNKNQMFLIEVFSYLLKECPKSVLQLIGFGEEYKGKLLKRTNHLRIKSRVKFLPSDSNKIEILENADLFIFPSISEGFPIALLEAQAMEVPCLVSDSIPKEIDCGLCKFLPLSGKHELWVKEAISIINHNFPLQLNKEKLISFNINKYAEKIKKVYDGSKYKK